VSSIIEDLIARKIFNNRGDETIEVDVITAGGFGRAGAPAGKSKGKAEVQYYPQGGVEAAVKKVDDLIAPDLAALTADFQKKSTTPCTKSTEPPTLKTSAATPLSQSAWQTQRQQQTATDSYYSNS